jgi:uncharacterized protein YdhG (YjbR/CyaY superfamily)
LGTPKNHIGFYPTPEAIDELKTEIRPCKSAKGSVQFPHKKPFPTILIERMAKARCRILEDSL